MGGVAGILAGGFYLLRSIVGLLNRGDSPFLSPDSPLDYSGNFALLGALLLTLPALTALHFRQRFSYGRLGAAATYLSLGGIFLAALSLPLATTRSEAAAAAGGFGLFILLAGITIIGFCTLKARVLPNWAGLLLIVGPTSVFVMQTFSVGWIFFGASIAAVGYALWSGAEASRVVDSRDSTVDYPHGERLERDESARLLVKEEPNAQAILELDGGRETLELPPPLLWILTRFQQFVPVQVSISEGIERWWFEDDLYIVKIEEGYPSQGLASETATPKLTMSGGAVVKEEGYSPDEVAEGAFELRDEEEGVRERLERLENAAALLMQFLAIRHEERSWQDDEWHRASVLEEDDSLRLVETGSAFWRKIYIESADSRPAEVLTKDVSRFEILSRLQQHHPVLLTRRTGRGRLWRTEITTEWWWFGNHFYKISFDKGFKSTALWKLEDQEATPSARLYSGVKIPKIALDDELTIGSSEGYSPEEIAQLAAELHSGGETLAEKYARITKAKHLLAHHYDQIKSPRQPLRTLREDYETKTNEGVDHGSYEDFLKDLLREATKSEEWFDGLDDKDIEKQPSLLVPHLDAMGGVQFEDFMADVFRHKGYEVEKTPASGDQGVDLLLNSPGARVAVQLKRYTGSVGNEAVQQVRAGMDYYDAVEGWVITTSSYTRSARQLADRIGVRLVDGLELKRLISD